MVAEAYGLKYCTFSLVLESKLSHRLKVQFCFVPKLSHHGGKNIALRAEKSLHCHLLLNYHPLKEK